MFTLVFSSLSHLATFLSPHYRSPHHAPTCLAYSTPSCLHPLPFSPLPHTFITLVLPTAQPLHWQRGGCNPSHSPQCSACWILLLWSSWRERMADGQAGRQTDRKADRQWKMHSAKNTKPLKHNSNIRDINIWCSHNHCCVCLFFSVHVFVCTLT